MTLQEASVVQTSTTDVILELAITVFPMVYSCAGEWGPAPHVLALVVAAALQVSSCKGAKIVRQAAVSTVQETPAAFLGQRNEFSTTTYIPIRDS
eukprot:768718-Hanusia_phi.AAC.1